MRNPSPSLLGKPLPALLLLLSAWMPAAFGQNSCVDCHRELEGSLGEPIQLYPRDVHAQVGLSCASCHGGNPSAAGMEEAKAPDTGFSGSPAFREIPDFCGRCHASADYMKQYNPSLRIDQVAEYRTSVHGRRSAQGDTQVATCTSCHSVHNIRRAQDPLSPVYPLNVVDTCARCHADPERMKPYSLSSEAVAEYRQSVHAAALYEQGDLSAPTCNDCHGNHGAVPPGVTSVALVCGSCHATQRELYQKSAHFEMFSLMGLRGCTTCHENHLVVAADESLLVGERSVCSSCHEAGDVGDEAARIMASRITGLRERIQAAQQLLEEAQQAGMEVSRPIYELHQAQEKVIFARHEVHSLNLEQLDSIVEEGLKIAEEAHGEGEEAFEQLRFRRKGLFASLAVILLVIVSLVLWIRQLESTAP